MSQSLGVMQVKCDCPFSLQLLIKQWIPWLIITHDSNRRLRTSFDRRQLIYSSIFLASEANASMSLNKLKEKLTQFKEDIDKAEEREIAANSLLKEAEAQEEKHTTEAEGIKRRMRLLQADLDKVNKRLEEQEEKLEQVTQKGEKEELFRKELEENEEEGDEKISELESLITEAAKDGEEKHHTLIEAKRRLVVIERDLKSAEEREEKYLRRIETLEASLERITEKTKDLEQADEDASEREQVTEEKIQFLEEQLKMTNVRIDDAERQQVKWERLSDSITDEINQWRDKIREVQAEMEEITTIADDIWRTGLHEICIPKNTHCCELTGTWSRAKSFIVQSCQENFYVISQTVYYKPFLMVNAGYYFLLSLGIFKAAIMQMCVFWR